MRPRALGRRAQARPQVRRFRTARGRRWLLGKPNTEFRSILLELMEPRCGMASTVFCMRFKKEDWQPRLGGGVHAGAIIDRIARNAVWLDMEETNMRERRG